MVNKCLQCRCQLVHWRKVKWKKINMITTVEYGIIGASIIGIIIFIYSALKIIAIMNLLPKESKTRTYWLYAIILIVLFGLGYFFSIVVILTDNKSLLDSITPIIYLFGSVFVLIVVLVSYRTYKAILESAE